ncbi:septation protein SepH [Agilicoccus flavus]|uniref:septation protein SepH n=1 Tax=Agilicoccus flavus TaxID=2775968 RepID=UPI001CF6E8F7|nr:septation protein SepH [Agilicoccus flavus]
MPDLHLIGVQEDGRHLLLRADGSDTEYRLPLDDALRAALRRDHGVRSTGSAPDEPLRPRDVQAMIRAGASAQETAERAGWPIEKVHRYEGPILAERAHVATIAGDSHVRGRTSGGPVTTLRDRVADRLEARGVDPDSAEWDSWRSEDGRWTVELRFAAGGRSRVASWAFSRSAMTADPVDDEARWLSGDDSPPARPATDHVIAPATGPRGPLRPQGPATRGGDDDRPRAAEVEPARGPRGEDRDLMTDLRERSAALSRRRGARRLATGGTGRGATPSLDLPGSADPRPLVDPALEPGAAPTTVRSPAHVPTVGVEPDSDTVPLEPFGYDPGRDGPPPAAHDAPLPDGPDAHPEPAAQAGRGEVRPGAVEREDVEREDVEHEPHVEIDPHVEHVSARRVTAPQTHLDPVPSGSDAVSDAASGPGSSGARPEPGSEPGPRVAADAAPVRERSVASANVHEPELPLGQESHVTDDTDVMDDTDVTDDTEVADAEPLDAGDDAAVDRPAPVTGTRSQAAGTPDPEVVDHDPTVAAPTTTPPAAPTPAPGPRTRRRTAKKAAPGGTTRSRSRSGSPAATGSARPAATPAAPTPNTPSAPNTPSTPQSPSSATPGQADEPTATATPTSPATTSAPNTRPAAHGTAAPAAPAPSTTSDPEAAADPTDATSAPRPAPRPSSRRKSRASVPSWDDIMFGAKHPDE